MPKSTTGKGTNKKVVSKNTTKKVNTKKTTPTKTVPKVEVKETSKKEVIKTNASEVKVDLVKTKKEQKGKKNFIKKAYYEIISDSKFAITLCIAIILFACLIAALFIRRIPKTKDGEEVLATINGKSFTADDLYIALKDEYGTDSLIDLIDTYIAKKEVEVTEEDEEYVQEVVDYYKSYAEYYGVDLETFLASYVGLSNITTEDEFFDFVLEDYKKTLAVKKFIGDNATEDELTAYYKENYSDSLTVKHILIEVDEDAEDSDAADKEAYDKAVSLIEELNDTDEDDLEDKFDELAEDNSDDTETYSNGGLIEDFQKKDVEEEFYEAAHDLKNGKYTTEPVKTSYGYHVILKISSTKVKAYKKIKDEVKNAYAESLLSADSTLSTTKWAELRKQYKLSIKDDDIRKAYKESISVDTEEEEDEDTEETEEE